MTTPNIAMRYAKNLARVAVGHSRRAKATGISQGFEYTPPWAPATRLYAFAPPDGGIEWAVGRAEPEQFPDDPASDDDYHLHLNAWGWSYVADRFWPPHEMDTSQDVTLGYDEGWCGTEDTGGDPPRLWLSVGCLHCGGHIFDIEPKRFHEVVRGIVAAKVATTNSTTNPGGNVG